MQMSRSRWQYNVIKYEFRSIKKEKKPQKQFKMSQVRILISPPINLDS